MKLFLSKRLRNMFIFALTLILFYAIFILVYPLVWGQYLSKTNAPTKNGEMTFGTNFDAKSLKVAVIGDSTAAGQGGKVVENSFSYQYLETNLAQKQEIKYTNLAVSGARIDEVLQNQVSEIPSSTDVIFISVGANDATAFLSKSDFENKLQELTQKLQTFPDAKVIWMSVPDFVTSPILLPPLNYFFSTKAKDFNSSIQLICNQKNFVYVDVFDSTRNEFWNNPDKNFARDKYHPSTEGYKLWSREIKNAIPNSPFESK